MSRWTDWTPALDKASNSYPPIPADASGIYAIRDASTGKVRYVGESHTGRLRKTLIRHFQQWSLDYQHTSPRTVYDPARSEVAWMPMKPDRDFSNIEDAEIRWMKELEPSDNITAPEELAYNFEAERRRLKRPRRHELEFIDADEPDDAAPF